jgi:hypothetical protein
MANRLKPGFVKANSDNLPYISVDSVTQYVTNHNDFVSAEIRGWKQEKSKRTSYGDNAVGYVSLKKRWRYLYFK